MTRRISYLFVYPALVALVDLLLINLSLFAIFYMDSRLDATAGQRLGLCVHVIPYLCLTSLAVFYGFDLYTNWTRRSRHDIVYSILISVFLLAIFITVVIWWEHGRSLSHTELAAAAVLQFLTVSIYRLGLKSWFLSGPGRRRAILVAEDEESAIAITTKIQECAPDWLFLAGYLLPDEFLELDSKTAQFDTVMIAPRLPQAAKIMKLCASLHKGAMVIPAMLELSVYGARPMEIGDVLIFRVNPPHLTVGQTLVKRAFDTAVSVILLILTAPLTIVTAIFIRMTSKGPAIFKQDRVGQGGVEYTLYKFRTMKTDAEKHTGPVLAADSDPRITPLGHWLRATRIDELPQLLNVLKGDMSMVGPRPERQFFVEQFRESVHGYEIRLAVKPGITGLAQVAGGYSTTVERKLRFDLMYIYNYSLMLDIQVLLRTVLVVLNRGKAAGVSVDPPPSVVADEQQFYD